MYDYYLRADVYETKGGTTRDGTNSRSSGIGPSEGR
jgi:hypothetical protein